MEKPRVNLIGASGNAFSIMGDCRKAAEEAGWSDEKIKGFIDEMKAGDYNHLLKVSMKHFDVR